MANTRPTPVSFIRAVWLCMLLLFSPRRFRIEEEDDSRLFKAAPSDSDRPCRTNTVRRAFLYSGALVALFGAIGYVSGVLLGAYFFCVTPQLIAWLQVAGACLLLWGTLFVRGWEIQTFGGVTLTERVNQWLYRFLYCIGTAVLVSSLAWPQCANGG